MNQVNRSDIEVMFLPEYVCMSLDGGNSKHMAIATGCDLGQVLKWLNDQPGSSGKYIVQQGYKNRASNLQQIYIKFRYKKNQNEFNIKVDRLATQFKLAWHNKEWPVNR